MKYLESNVGGIIKIAIGHEIVKTNGPPIIGGQSQGSAWYILSHHVSTRLPPSFEKRLHEYET